MPYVQEIESCFAARIGAPGLSEELYAPLLEATAAGLKELARHRAEHSLALLALPNARDDLAPARAVAARLGRDFARVLVLGTGGSSLGGQALAALAEDPGAGAPRLDFLDNIDPRSFTALLDGLDLAETGFVVISKSGETVETLAQTLVCLEALKKERGEGRLARHVVVVTEPGEGTLRRLALALGLEVLDHDPDIGGRYSVLSVVGLLPALIAGLDAEAVREGAARVLDSSLAAASPGDSAPAVGAALSVALARHRGVRVSVLMAYADRLERFAMWHRQLWAESLGKQGAGTTPGAALGPVDQHSQLQLYLDGPADKMFTLIVPATAGLGPRINGALAPAAARAAGLAGLTVGDLVDAQQRATIKTLERRARPTRVFRLAALDEGTLGALFMHFMLETFLAARLLGVEPFDQPAVEEGKALTRHYLEQRGSP